jgi:nucleotide-binding universal stress UspA family protein
MHSILVPIDGSLQARHALKHVISSIKEGLQAEIHIINVQPIVLPLGELPLIDADLIEKAQHEQAKKLLKSACDLLERSELKCTQHSEVGPIASTIVDYAKKHSCDSIVMGCRGMGALGNLVLGSIANQVVHLTEIPVTLVK